jgi:DMSO/TMAO reductase YedYZ molybdopterin-dependent catalytic subunit
MFTRRAMLKILNALGLAIAAPMIGLRELWAESFPTRTVEKKDFSFDPESGLVEWKSQGRKQEYRLIIDGLAAKPISLSYADLRKLPLITQASDFHCVEGWTIPKVSWTGFRFKELLDRVKPLPEAKYVVFHSLGETHGKPDGRSHYVESFSIDQLLDDAQQILLVLDKEGKPLSNERGAPLRVIAPFKQAYKSIKFVTRVEFVKDKQPGWWTLANSVYDWEANVPAARLRIK